MSRQTYLKARVAKSQVAPGVFKPITSRWNGQQVVNSDVRNALRVRLKGAPVFHGGESSRVSRIVRGRSVDTGSDTGFGARHRGVFTTTSRHDAESYAVAGRNPRNYAKYGDHKMNDRIWPRSRKGKVAELNMKGVWPKAVGSIWGGNTELVYDAKDIPSRVVGVSGAKRARSHFVKLRMADRTEADEFVREGREVVRSDRVSAARLKHGLPAPALGLRDIKAQWAVGGVPTQAERSAAGRRKVLR